jgi:integrase/recombinase XerC
MNDAAADWIKRFLAHLSTERRLSAHTSTAYAHDLQECMAWCVKQSIAEWTQLDSQHLRAFAAAEHRRGIGPRSIQRRLSTLRSFFNYLIREAQLKTNPALDVRAPKAPKRLPVTLDADQMARLLEFRADAELDKRDKAIMELFYSSGLRLAELVGLNVMDLDLADRTVRVLGKGNKTRVIPIGRYAITAVQEWLQERSALPLQDAAAVFVSRQETPDAARHSAALAQWASGRVWASTCIHICSVIRLPQIAGISWTCAASRAAGHANISLRRCTPTLISSISPKYTMQPIAGGPEKTAASDV